MKYWKWNHSTTKTNNNNNFFFIYTASQWKKWIIYVFFSLPSLTIWWCRREILLNINCSNQEKRGSFYVNIAPIRQIKDFNWKKNSRYFCLSTLSRLAATNKGDNEVVLVILINDVIKNIYILPFSYLIILWIEQHPHKKTVKLFSCL